MGPDKADDFRKSTIDKHDGNQASSSSTKQRQRSDSTSSSVSNSSGTSSSSITSLFESSLALLGSLPVATSTSSKDKPIIHKSLHYGSFKLYLNVEADNYEEIQLQSHLLWPSSPRLAEMMEEKKQNDISNIDIKGQTVLELGAGSALLSLLAARMGAFHVAITDYPAPGIMSAIRKNVSVNLNMEEQSRVSITALDWTDENALEAVSQKHPKGFTRILAADTLWMGHLNASQLKVMTRLLSQSPDSRIIIVAGLHTGRFVIQSFLKMAMAGGLEIERAQEIDRREEREKGIDWKRIVEDGNNHQDEIVEGIEEERRRWLVHIVLKRSERHLAR